MYQQIPKDFAKHEWKLGPYYQGKWSIYLGQPYGPTVCHAFSEEVARHIIQIHNKNLRRL